MATLSDCFLSSVRINAAKEQVVKSDPDLVLLSTGICAIGRGEVKLMDVVELNDRTTNLIFSTTEGYPLLRVRTIKNPTSEEKKERIEVFCPYSATGMISTSVVRSNDVRYILKQLGEVRQSHTIRARQRKRDIQNIGKSMADLVARVRGWVGGDIVAAFSWSLRQNAFEVKVPEALSSSRMDDKTLWALLQVFIGEKAASEVVDPSVQQEILTKYTQITSILGQAREKWESFRQFWDKPKIIVGLLPRDRGLVVGHYCFKDKAEKVLANVEKWEYPAMPFGATSPFTFKYYDSVDSIEEPLLTQIKGKCGFVKMFGSNSFPWTGVFLGTDPEAVLPVSKIDNLWKDINFMSYATMNTDMDYFNWFIMDYDGEEA